MPSEKLEAQLARREFDQALADLRANKVAPPFDFWQLALEALAVKDPKADAVADQALMELTKRGSKASRKAALVALNKEPFDAKLLIESASLFDLKPMALTVLGLKHSLIKLHALRRHESSTSTLARPHKRSRRLWANLARDLVESCRQLPNERGTIGPSLSWADQWSRPEVVLGRSTGLTPGNRL